MDGRLGAGRGGVLQELVTQGHGCRYSLLHANRVQGARAFPPKSLDVAFINGLHTYEGVVEVLAAWRPKVKDGGLLLFNDYGDATFPGCVACAVGGAWFQRNAVCDIQPHILVRSLITARELVASRLFIRYALWRSVKKAVDEWAESKGETVVCCMIGWNAHVLLHTKQS